MPLKKLTPKQQLFVAEHIIDFDGAKAVRRAGYKVTSGGSAASMAHIMLAKPGIQAAIAAAMVERVKRVKVDADWVLQTLFEEATADLADLYDEDGALLPIRQWPKIFRTGLVVGIEVEEVFEGYGKDRVQTGFMRKVKLSDRLKHKELIGKHVDVQAFRERVQHETPADGPLAQLFQQITGTSVKPKK